MVPSIAKKYNSTSVICLHIVQGSNISDWPVDGTLSSTTSQGQTGSGINANEEVRYIS